MVVQRCRASDLRSRAAYNDSGQVVHTRVPRRRQSSLPYGVVKESAIPLPLRLVRVVIRRCGSRNLQ